MWLFMLNLHEESLQTHTEYVAVCIHAVRIYVHVVCVASYSDVDNVKLQHTQKHSMRTFSMYVRMCVCT